MFKIFRKCQRFYGIVKTITEKITKNIAENIAVFFKTFIRTSELCNALLTSRFKISFLTFFWSTLIKLKLPLSLHLFWIAILLGWFLYFKIAFKVGSLVLLTKGSSFEYLELSRFCTILEKKLFKTSAVSRSVFTSSLPATLSDRRGFRE